MTNLDSILKSKRYFFNKGPSSQGYGFSSSHVWVWELDYKGSWALKNWCFWTVVLEKTIESPLYCKEIQQVPPKGDQSWVFIGRTDVEAPILWSPDVESWLVWKDPDDGKDWGQEEKGRTENEMVGWHHWLGINSGSWWWTREAWCAVVHGVSKSQTRLSDWTELNWTESIWPNLYLFIMRTISILWIDKKCWSFNFRESMKKIYR